MKPDNIYPLSKKSIAKGARRRNRTQFLSPSEVTRSPPRPLRFLVYAPCFLIINFRRLGPETSANSFGPRDRDYLRWNPIVGPRQASATSGPYEDGHLGPLKGQRWSSFSPPNQRRSKGRESSPHLLPSQVRLQANPAGHRFGT